MNSQTLANVNMALKLAIVHSRMTQRRLARRIRIDETRLSRIISRQAIPFPRERKKIARALKVSEAEIFPETVPQSEQAVSA